MPEPRMSGYSSAWGAFAVIGLAVSLGLCASPAVGEGALAASGDPAPAFLWNSFFVGMRPPQPGEETGAALRLMSAGRPEAAASPDLYLGYQKKVDGVNFGATASFVPQPAAVETAFASDAAQSSYWRFKAGASTNLVEGMQLGFNVQYAPDGAAYLDGPAQDFSSFARALSHNAAINPGGYPSGAGDVGVEDVRYDVGLSLKLPYQSKVDLRYYKTIEGPTMACSGSCPAFFAAALQTKF